MSENTWPNPDRPGIPLNPDRDGWHWVKIIYGISHPRPRLWGSKIDRWELSDGALINPSEFAERWRYLGPCLTPAEIAAKDARIADLEAQLAALQRDASQQTSADDLVKRLQHLGDWQAADRITAQAAEIARLRDAPAALRSETKLNPDRWRGAINDALTNWLDTIRDEDVPKDALRRLVAYEVTAALDPAVSQAAADLIANARREGMEEAAKRLEELHKNHGYDAKTGEVRRHGKLVTCPFTIDHTIGYYRALAEGAAHILRAAAKEGKP